ncbi:DUF1990 family protein [Leucobacter aridicollis]|uniref:DUF1990 family protein n=1 Tax=Leucobacter aridicollis TaxID=283878 RepID=UPI0011C45E62|nr:DUF1990 family protein [Leucobacter aridicollis]MCS3428224.1 uncharacterized protein (UPF0548 family) [Leucobacter aridicollis]
MNAPRRSSYTAMPVAYAAIGASGAPDLMRFPPAGSTPYEEALQLGSGQERFLAAANQLMTWGAHRAAGFVVSDIEVGEQADYVGVQFDDGGTPELGEEPEELFSPEGEAYVLPGTTATLSSEKAKQPRPILVISTVDEPQRLGFAWGDREAVTGFGEQLLTVEQRADGTVWAVARGFTFLTSSGLMAGIKQRGELRDVIELAQALVGALAPGAAIRGGVVPADTDAPADPDASAHTDGDASQDN